jgi:protein-S-isoprenylcysteine O-methyltransferase Ste14
LTLNWLLISLLAFTLNVPLYYLSLEHRHLETRFGVERGRRVGDALGMASGWGMFVYWIGIWVSPQNRFDIPFGSSLLRLMGLDVTTAHLVVSVLFLAPAVFFGVGGVMELGLRVSETHRPVAVVESGVYGHVRHPQYLGGFLAHIGVSVLLSARDSLLLSPIILVLLYIVCRKEEAELVNEFGQDYVEYRDRVPMLLPRIRALGFEAHI